MASPLLQLREASKAFSPAEKEVAIHILKNPELVKDLSVHELAKQTFSSPSTIVRLCCHTGFSGYREFRQAVVEELAEDRQNSSLCQKELQPYDSLEAIVEKITYKNIQSLMDTKKLVDLHTLQQCVDLIHSARIVYLFGIGASLCAAKDAYLKFLRLNKPCIINEDYHSQLIQSRNACPQDLALIFSYSGNTVEMVECMKSLKKSSTPIIAITRCVSSPVSELADFLLYTTANESLFRSGAMSSRISQLNIVDILYTALASQDHGNSLKQLSKTHIHKPGEGAI